MSKKRISKTKYVAVFAVTTLIFIIGFFLGNKIGEVKLNKLTEIENDLRTDTTSLELQYLLLADNPCSAMNSTFLSDELYKLGSRLDYMERTKGVNDPDVLRLKEQFSLLQIRHWLFLKNAKKECDTDHDFILYFYSNQGDCTSCEEQGYVLSYIREKYPNTKVYAFDINIDNEAVSTIKELYLENSTIPSFIINDYPYYGFKDKESMEKLIKIKRF